MGPLASTARSDHESNVFGIRLGAGYEIEAASWRLRPFFNLSYVLLDEAGFTESGGGAASLDVEERLTNSLVSELGLRVARAWQTELGTFVPYLSAAWEHDATIDDRSVVSGSRAPARPSRSAAGASTATGP